MCYNDSDINFQGLLRKQPDSGTLKLSFRMKDIQPENLNTSTKSNKMLVWGFLDMLSLNVPQFVYSSRELLPLNFQTHDNVNWFSGIYARFLVQTIPRLKAKEFLKQLRH